MSISTKDFEAVNTNQSLKLTELLKVIKRDSSIISFNPNKISIAITKAFLDEEGHESINSTRIHDLAAKLTSEVCSSLNRYLKILREKSLHQDSNENVLPILLLASLTMF